MRSARRQPGASSRANGNASANTSTNARWIRGAVPAVADAGRGRWSRRAARLRLGGGGPPAIPGGSGGNGGRGGSTATGGGAGTGGNSTAVASARAARHRKRGGGEGGTAATGWKHGRRAAAPRCGGVGWRGRRCRRRGARRRRRHPARRQVRGPDRRARRRREAAYRNGRPTLLTADGAGGFLRVRRPNRRARVNSTVPRGSRTGCCWRVHERPADIRSAVAVSQRWLDGNGLMHWYINAAGTMPLGTGAATDSDEDMAFALLLADRRWGGSGSLTQTYLSHALRQIDLICSSKWTTPRGRADPRRRLRGGRGDQHLLFAPAFYRAFAARRDRAPTGRAWSNRPTPRFAAALNAANGNVSHGLVRLVDTGRGSQAPPNTGHPVHPSWICREPFRLPRITAGTTSRARSTTCKG